MDEGNFMTNKKDVLKGQDYFIYIPLSSFIILLVILLTCASRKKKIDAFNTTEQNLENDIKRDYAIMCFPCLKKRPDIKNIEQTADLSDQFEYIVEKYTIRKVPLLMANTAEDIIERQEELLMSEANETQQNPYKDDFINFHLAQEMYNIQRVPPCITVAANTVCPGRKTVKERKPCDILESMSPVTRPTVKNTKYVVIPTKASLRNKDIMMTKREITNQYLNNFSSVFVDNLKDQVPKDPDCFPNISRPYSSTYRNLSFGDNFVKGKTAMNRRGKRGKVHKVAYVSQDLTEKDEDSIREEEEEPYYDSDTISKDPTTDALESEFLEENEFENDQLLTTEKSKSLVLLHDSDSAESVKDVEGTTNRFKMTIKSSVSGCENNISRSIESDVQNNSIASHKEDWTNAKVTYEDIQALDVGYEFTSCEKLGVKPKMTRIHYPHETERLKDGKQAPENKTGRRNYFIVEQPSLQSTYRPSNKPKQISRMGETIYSNSGSLKEKLSCKSVMTETSFVPMINNDKLIDDKETIMNIEGHTISTTTIVESKSEGSRSHLIDPDLMESRSGTLDENIAEISKLYDLTIPLNLGQPIMDCDTDTPIDASDDVCKKFPGPSKSRSFHDTGRVIARKELGSEAKGNDYSTFTSSFENTKSYTRLPEVETETSCSLLSRDSKTSSEVTSPRSSEKDEGKRATLRWKIIIKHHRDEDSPRKNVNKNIKL